MKKYYLQVIFITAGLFLAFCPFPLAEAFTHPGLLNNQAELDLIREKVNAGEQPWLSGYQKLDDWFQDLANRGYPITPGVTMLDRYRNYQPLVLGYTLQNGEVRPPVTSFCWESTGGKAQELMFDSRAAYASALHWVVTGDIVYGDKVVKIINDWTNTLKTVSFNCSADGSYNAHTKLMIAGSLPQMIFAAEIIRATYPGGWNIADQDKFKNFLLTKMYPNVLTPNRSASECTGGATSANWAVMGSEARMAIAIFTDSVDKYNEAILDYKFYIEKSFKPYGKNIETCRFGGSTFGCNVTIGGDLPHTQMTLQALTAMAEMGKKQGIDLYDYVDPADGHSLFTTLTYHAPFMGYDDDPTKSRPGASKADWPCETQLSGPCVAGQQCSNPGLMNSFWEMAYNHYKNQDSEQKLKSLVENFARPEGNRAWSDVGWGTLTHNYSGVFFAAQDVNEDGHVNIKDIQICIKGIIDQNSIPSEQLQKCQAVAPPIDVVNIKDIQEIIRKIINPN